MEAKRGDVVKLRRLTSLYLEEGGRRQTALDLYSSVGFKPTQFEPPALEARVVQLVHVQHSPQIDLGGVRLVRQVLLREAPRCT